MSSAEREREREGGGRVIYTRLIEKQEYCGICLLVEIQTAQNKTCDINSPTNRIE